MLRLCPMYATLLLEYKLAPLFTIVNPAAGAIAVRALPEPDSSPVQVTFNELEPEVLLALPAIVVAPVFASNVDEMIVAALANPVVAMRLAIVIVFFMLLFFYWFVLLISGLPEINTFTNNSVIQKILTSLVKINDFFFILHSTTINNETKNPPSRGLTDKTKRFNI